MVFTVVERENMINFILQIYTRHFTREYLLGLTDDNLDKLYNEAYNYSDWGL